MALLKPPKADGGNENAKRLKDEVIDDEAGIVQRKAVKDYGTSLNAAGAAVCKPANAGKVDGEQQCHQRQADNKSDDIHHHTEGVERKGLVAHLFEHFLPNLFFACRRFAIAADDEQWRKERYRDHQQHEQNQVAVIHESS